MINIDKLEEALNTCWRTRSAEQHGIIDKYARLYALIYSHLKGALVLIDTMARGLSYNGIGDRIEALKAYEAFKSTNELTKIIEKMEG